MRRHPKFGSRAVRFQFQNFKRVLQYRRGKSHRQVRMKNDAFFKQLYRIDVIEEDWATVSCNGEPAAAAEKPDAMASCRKEYLQGVLVPNGYFSVPSKTAEVNADGVAEEVFRDRFPCERPLNQILEP